MKHKTNYLKAQARAKNKNLAKWIVSFIGFIGLLLGSFHLGKSYGRVAGLIQGAQELTICENNGATGFYIDDTGNVVCIY